jgi:hypothetical protein
MGYIDNTLVTIDAVVTKRGRELLSQGRGKFKVAKFAVADDEVDYRLWDTGNSNGSAYYGQAIENMSVIEANANGDKTVNYKLMNLPKNVSSVPVMQLAGGDYAPNIDSYPLGPLVLSPITFNPSDGNSTKGYTATVSDASIIKIEGMGNSVTGGTRSAQLGNTDFIIDPATGNSTVKATGDYFEVMPFPLRPGTSIETTTVTIIGNETAGKLIVKVSVMPPPQNNMPNTFGLPSGFSMGN